MRPLRVLHVIPAFYPATRYGGPTESVYRMCLALPDQGVHVDVVTTDADGPESLAVPIDVPTTYEGVPVRYFHRALRSETKPSWGLFRHVLRVRHDYDIIHITAIFSLPSTTTALIARASNVPYVISPRGILRRPALAQKAWKKAPYWYAIERGNGARAAAIHATSELEAEEIREALPGANVVIVPNGTVLHAPIIDVPRDPATVLFLGRLHPIKGLDVLVRAASLASARGTPLRVVLAGPDDVGEWARIERLVAELSPRPDVVWVGPVAGEEKARWLARATVLALLSQSENFGQVVLEALAAETPVVVSRGCPWAIAEDEGAGFWVHATPSEVADALLQIVSDPAKARSMGRAGRRVAERFGWPDAARKMADLYRSLISHFGGPQNSLSRSPSPLTS